jgi:hypothetical protein
MERKRVDHYVAIDFVAQFEKFAGTSDASNPTAAGRTDPSANANPHHKDP